MAASMRVLVVGCGHMGSSHARAYHRMAGFEIVGLVSRGPETREKLSGELGGLKTFDSFDRALSETQPDAVSVNTYPETHAEYTLKALDAGCHVFVEKPIAMTVAEAESVRAAAAAKKRKVVVGYILRVHPAWQRFVEIAQTLGKPLVMRMNLNQQSSADEWTWHKHLLESMPPIMDCGVHYVDVMCQMAGARPVRVHAIEARLSDEIDRRAFNYGQLQVVFDDESVGWYEAGWGPMMSETAYFVKDVIGPRGCVSMVSADQTGGSADIDSHTKTNQLRVHHGQLNREGGFSREDDVIDMSDDPSHQELCDLEQAYFLKAIREDLDLDRHLSDGVNSLRIVLAADKSFRTGRSVNLPES